ncbi:hypothetical protein T07_3039 [Trichinella nelsoni]|uniref:Uncharacterized protein n=1 Tax=Trichinella nelsoni TaxID=6336 RepID=A0A0V0RND5_9BILA|nr:hypothetical protein T07_3039 [Trichinella nelsoni]
MRRAVSIGWVMRKVTSIELHSNFPVPYRVKLELEIRNYHYSATGRISLTALILASCTVRLQTHEADSIFPLDNSVRKFPNQLLGFHIRPAFIRSSSVINLHQTDQIRSIPGHSILLFSFDSS